MRMMKTVNFRTKLLTFLVYHENNAHLYRAHLILEIYHFHYLWPKCSETVHFRIIIIGKDSISYSSYHLNNKNVFEFLPYSVKTVFKTWKNLDVTTQYFLSVFGNSCSTWNMQLVKQKRNWFGARKLLHSALLEQRSVICRHQTSNTHFIAFLNPTISTATKNSLDVLARS